MATLNAMSIRVEIEPIVKLLCCNLTCRFNRGGTCDLKHVRLDETGLCAESEPKQAGK